MTNPTPEFSANTDLAILGVGLMGGSLAAALKANGHAGRIIGVGRNAERLQLACERGLIDDFATDVRNVTATGWIVCTPVDRVAADVKTIAEQAPNAVWITDVGSVKAAIWDQYAASTAESSTVEFVGSHPLAGSERQGFEAADPELYQGRICVVTPEPTNTTPARQAVTRLWEAVGMTVRVMQPEQHDEILATTSHLPHMVAAVLAGCLTENELEFAATGFADTTRIASGDPALWTAIAALNRSALLASLQRFEDQLALFRAAIAAENTDAVPSGRSEAALFDLLSAAKRNRDALVQDRRATVDTSAIQKPEEATGD